MNFKFFPVFILLISALSLSVIAENTGNKIGEIALYKKSVHLLYDVDFVTYFDNREYSAPQIDQTIFGTRLSPEIGIGITDKAGGAHKVILGVNAMQRIGAPLRESNWELFAYYQFKRNGFRVGLGSIPFTMMIEKLPDYLEYDSLVYARPNIQGGLMQYESKHGFVEFVCDWRGAESEERREAFRLIVNGRYKRNLFFAGSYLAMNHLAGYAGNRVGVSEQVSAIPYVGLDLGKALRLDSFTLKAGYYVSYDKIRKLDMLEITQGAELDFFVRWRFLALRNTTHIGNNLLPHYWHNGKELYQSEPFYQCRFYNRTDMVVFLYNTSFVNCYFSYNLHVTEGAKLGHQQQLIARFNLAGFNQKNKLKGILGK